MTLHPFAVFVPQTLATIGLHNLNTSDVVKLNTINGILSYTIIHINLTLESVRLNKVYKKKRITKSVFGIH